CPDLENGVGYNFYVLRGLDKSSWTFSTYSPKLYEYAGYDSNHQLRNIVNIFEKFQRSIVESFRYIKYNVFVLFPFDYRQTYFWEFEGGSSENPLLLLSFEEIRFNDPFELLYKILINTAVTNGFTVF